MKTKTLYVIFGVVLLGGVTFLFVNNGVLQNIAQSCSSDANRPCFEQEIANKSQAAVGGVVKKEKLDVEKGQTEFAACIKNEANRRGQEKDKTKICDAEIIKYCEGAWNGDKNNTENGFSRIKKYEGKCEPEPGPTPPPPSNSKPVSITTTSLPTATLQMRYRAELGVRGGTAPYTWSISSGVLPIGVTLDPKTGVISGLLQYIVYSDGLKLFTVWQAELFGKTMIAFEVVDAVGSRATKSLSLVIKRVVEPELGFTLLEIDMGRDNIGYGITISQMYLSNSRLTSVGTAWGYGFANDDSKTAYYLKYGSGAKPDHLSIELSNLRSGETFDQLVDVQITTDTVPKIVYLPAVHAVTECDTQWWGVYIAKDGSTYYSRSDHSCGLPGLSPEQALVPQHLARGASATPDLSARPSSPTDFSPNSMRSSTISGAEIIKITPTK